MFPHQLLPFLALLAKSLFVSLLLLFGSVLLWILKMFVNAPSDPLRNLLGPDGAYLQNHFREVMDPNITPEKYDEFVKSYGKTFRFHGFGKHDFRLLSFDFRAVSHILNSPIYEKPWPTRSMLSKWLGRGVSVMEGAEHRLQRKIIGPAFTGPSVRALTPIFFHKAEELRDRWDSIVCQGYDTSDGPLPKTTSSSSSPVEFASHAIINITHWLSRATFDVIGLAGFDYHFHALHDESEEVYRAYSRMFKTIDKGPGMRTYIQLFFPLLEKIWPDECARITKESLRIIHSAGKKLMEDKKASILAEKYRMKEIQDKDILTLLIKSNLAADPRKRLSDADILDQLSTFLFAGSDTTSLAISYCLHLLSLHPELQTRLREEIISLSFNTPPPSPSSPDTSANQSLIRYADAIDSLPFLDSVVREVLRISPPVHGTIRVATVDDLIPVSHPMVLRDRTEVPAGGHIPIRKGSYIHIPIEGFNLSEDIWGKDAKVFNPDRWKNLPQTTVGRPPTHPGLASLMTFSFGPHSCPGYRFSIMETKVFVATLIPYFEFEPAECIKKFNAVVTRPFVDGEFDSGSRLPIKVRRYVQ